jgi:hypothetical protein
MGDVCVGIDGYEYCSPAGLLVLAIVIECVFYAFLFFGGWSMIRRWRTKRQERKAKEWRSSFPD